MPHDDEFGYLLHNLATREDFSTYTEGEALSLTREFGDGADWSLWKVSRDGSGEPTMVAVGCGPVETPEVSANSCYRWANVCQDAHMLDDADLKRVARRTISVDEAFRAAVYMASQYIALEREPDAGLVLFEQYLRSDPAAWGDWLRSVVEALNDDGAASPVDVVRIAGDSVYTD